MKNGLIHIYYGNGKGKTTAGMGLCLRALGHNNKVLIFQFLKSGKTGEEISLQKLGVTIFKDKTNTKFWWNMNDDEKIEYKKSQQALFNKLKNIIDDYDLIFLDEILDAINRDILTEEDVILLLKNKKQHQEIVLTGRKPQNNIRELASYISLISAEQHPYNNGIKARRGIEF